MPVPVDSQGGPVLGSSSTPTSAGAFSLYDIPTELNDYLNATSGGKLWFDIGHRKTTETMIGGEDPVAEPGLVGAAGGMEYTPGSANAAEHDVTTSHKHEAYDIYQKPWQVMQQWQAMRYNDPAKFLQLQTALAALPGIGKVNINGTFDHNTEAALGNAMLQYVKDSMGAGITPIYKDPKTGKVSGGFAGWLSAERRDRSGERRCRFQPGQRRSQLADPGDRPGEHPAGGAASGAGSAGAERPEGPAPQVRGEVPGELRSPRSRRPAVLSRQPDLGAEAMSFVQKSNPEEYKANQRMSYLDSLVNLLGGSVTSRPNQQPTPGV
jgi:hypothetical protein